MTKTTFSTETNLSDNTLNELFKISESHLKQILEADTEELKEILKSSYNEEENYLKEKLHTDLRNIQEMQLILKENADAFEEFLQNPEYKEILQKILVQGGLLGK